VKGETEVRLSPASHNSHRERGGPHRLCAAEVAKKSQSARGSGRRSAGESHEWRAGGTQCGDSGGRSCETLKARYRTRANALQPCSDSQALRACRAGDKLGRGQRL